MFLLRMYYECPINMDKEKLEAFDFLIRFINTLMYNFAISSLFKLQQSLTKQTRRDLFDHNC